MMRGKAGFQWKVCCKNCVSANCKAARCGCRELFVLVLWQNILTHWWIGIIEVS
jgi:hypothetical protein